MCGCVREYQERGFNRVERLSAKIRTVDLPIIIGGMISPVFKCDPFILPFSKVNNTDKRDYLQPSLFISIWLLKKKKRNEKQEISFIINSFINNCE